jgi:hypothetical protein
MKRILLVSFYIILTSAANGQEFSAKKLMAMLSETTLKRESHLTGKKYHAAGIASLGDTIVKTFQYRPKMRGKKKGVDSVERKVVISSLKETFTLTYQTTLKQEYTGIIESLKKDSFHCEYEKDTTVSPPSYLYQHEDYTADASAIKQDGVTWYSITFFKKELSTSRDLHFAEDLLQFTSHALYYLSTPAGRLFLCGKTDLTGKS